MAKKKEDLSSEEFLEQALISESEQPYHVPENWKWVNLGNTVTIKRGASPRPIKAFVTEDENGVNWIKIGDTGEGKHVYSVKEKITPEGAKKSVYVKRGTLLLSNSMSFGRPYILDIDGCIHDGWLAITVSNYFEKEYMYYALLASDWYFDQVAVGTAVRNLNSERVAGMPIPLPPLAEQQRIVDRIESFFEKLDQAKGLIQDALDSFENRKAAILHKAFSGELTRKWREENGVGLESWEKRPFKDIIFESKLGLVRNTNEQSLNCKYKYLKMNNIHRDGYLDYENITYVDASINEVELFTLKNGDFLFNTRNSRDLVGKNAIYKDLFAEPILYNNNIMRVRFVVDIISNFVSYYLNSTKGKTELDQIKKVTTNVAAIYAKDLNKIVIPVPSIPEQNEIVRIIDNLFEKEQNAKELYDVIDKIDMIKKSILSRAFRGELGTNDPLEESAVGLLEEVLAQQSHSNKMD